jgi:integrase
MVAPDAKINRSWLTASSRHRQQRRRDGQAEKNFHSFRHQWIDERLKAGCDLYLVQQLAGHKLRGAELSHYYHGLSVEQMVGVVEAVRLPLQSTQVNLRQPLETRCDGETHFVT